MYIVSTSNTDDYILKLKKIVDSNERIIFTEFVQNAYVIHNQNNYVLIFIEPFPIFIHCKNIGCRKIIKIDD